MSKWWNTVLSDRPNLRRATDEQVRSIFDRRAIREEVWRTRPYTPYEAGDWDTVSRAEPRYEQLLRAGQVNFLRGLVNQRPGLVMRRDCWDSRTLLAQIRPFKFKELDLDLRGTYDAQDEGVWKERWYHDHEDEHEHAGARAYVVPSPTSKHRRRDSAKKRADDVYMPIHIAQAHHGDDPGDGVPHHHYPAAHVASPYHSGKGRRGEHGHDEFAKYVYAPGQPTNMIDVHPLAWGLLTTPPGQMPKTEDPHLDWAPIGGSVAYLALEGVLKNDSILSTGAPVANVGSVTLWDDESRDDGSRGAQAFSWFIYKYLAAFGRTVVVVPDSDASGNDLVMTQARQIVERLKVEQGGLTREDENPLGRVVIATPTATCGDVCRHLTRDTGRTAPDGTPVLLPNEDHKRGVDDYLGDGEKLENLVVTTMAEQQSEPAVLRHRRDQFERDTVILEHLRRVCADDGVAIVPQRQVGATVGWSQPQVREALRSLAEQKLLAFEDPAPYFLGQPRELGRKPSTVVRLRADLVPHREEPMRLGEYLETYQ